MRGARNEISSSTCRRHPHVCSLYGELRKPIDKILDVNGLLGFPAAAGSGNCRNEMR